MITLTSNVREVSVRLYKRLLNISTPENLDKLSREIAISIAGEMADRIHEQGKDSSGGQIGVYSKGYMAVRSGVFASNVPYKSGKNKGKPKPTGVFTKGKNKGKPRPIYPKHITDPKVILALTDQMRGDFTLGIDNPDPTKTPDGYGIGFKNNDNFKKSQWAEDTYKKPIYNLTTEEKGQVRKIAEDFINRGIKKI